MKKPLFYSLPPAGHKVPVQRILGCLAYSSQERYSGAVEHIKGYLGNDNILYLSSGRAALWLYLKALSHLRPDRKEVLVPAYTCPSIVTAVLKAGLTPVLCDNNLDDFGYLGEDIEKKINRNTLAVIVVHLYGSPVKLEKIQALCRATGPSLVDDAAQAFGNTFQNEQDVKLGLKGDAGFYSFGRGKPISIMHGGLLVIDDPDEYHEAWQILQGLSRCTETVHYCMLLSLYALFSHPRLYWLPQMIPALNLGETVYEPEFKTNRGLNEAAALLSEMIPALEEEKKSRSINSKWYSDNLPEGFVRSGSSQGGYPYLRYPLMIDDRNLRTRILEKLIEEGMGATGSYPCPLNQLPKLKEVLADFTEHKNAKKISESIVTLPVHSGVSEMGRETIKSIIYQVSHAN